MLLTKERCENMLSMLELSNKLALIAGGSLYSDLVLKESLTQLKAISERVDEAISSCENRLNGAEANSHAMQDGAIIISQVLCHIGS